MTGFSQVLSRAGIHSSLTLGSLLNTVLEDTGNYSAASAVQQLQDILGSISNVTQTLNSLPSSPTIYLGNFKATLSSGDMLQPLSTADGNLFQQTRFPPTATTPSIAAGSARHSTRPSSAARTSTASIRWCSSRTWKCRGRIRS
jgi:hypothetical protein